jgi:DNA-binding NtrC family response regulator
MRQVVETVRAVAASMRPVLIAGESGSGRTTVARAVHGSDATRADGPFVVVDCPAHGPSDLERRLFGGLEPAAKAGPLRVSAGSAIADAHKGTLFLRHVTEAPTRVQALLARLLRDREAVIERVGTRELDTRFMASVEAAVGEAVADGRLRRDLYERLAQDRVDVPPLRRRREDLPHLITALVRQHSTGLGRERCLSRSAMAVLVAMPYPGNGRELAEIVDRVVAAGSAPVIQVEDVLAHVSLEAIGMRVDDGVTLREARARFERDCITAMLTRHHGRMGDAAKALGIQRTNLYRKVRQLKVARSLIAPRKHPL